MVEDWVPCDHDDFLYLCFISLAFYRHRSHIVSWENILRSITLRCLPASEDENELKVEEALHCLERI